MAAEEEIIPKPPSHAVATALLVASTVGVLLNIMIVWNELFSTYLTTQVPKAAYSGDRPHNPLTLAEKGKPVDYYQIDFGNKAIEDDLNLGSGGS